MLPTVMCTFGVHLESMICYYDPIKPFDLYNTFDISLLVITIRI